MFTISCHFNILSFQNVSVQSDDCDQSSDGSEEFNFGDDEAVQQGESGELSNTPIPAPVSQLFIFCLVWQAFYKISNGAIAALLRFLKFFLTALGLAFGCDTIVSLGKIIPMTRNGLRTALSLHDEPFETFIVCPKCDSIYSKQHCRRGSKFVATTCSNKPFPNHPMTSMRKPCGTQLMKSIKTRSGINVKPIRFIHIRTFRML